MPSLSEPCGLNQLSSLAYTVRADQEDLSARFETQRAQFTR